MKITKKAFGCVWLALVLILTYLPILIIAVYSFTDAKMVGGHINGGSVANYVNLLKNEELRNMIFGTVL
ncbi:MAG: ABC transporter permease, partial [Clostridia bacterium]|nr:ABC transporter permease [Clostridia bacterium]